MSPQGSYLVLSANIPHIEFDIFVRNGLNVEADGRDGGHVLVQLELVENRYDLMSALSFHTQVFRPRAENCLLVFPAASSPNMSNRISLDPNSLPMIFETCPPIVAVMLCCVLDPEAAVHLICA